MNLKNSTNLKISKLCFRRYWSYNVLSHEFNTTVRYIRWKATVIHTCTQEWFTALLFSNNQNIQGDSREKVNILRVNYIRHCEEKDSCEHVSHSEWLPRWSYLNLLRTVLPCPLDFCLWIGMKSDICKWEVDTRYRIFNAAARIKIREDQIRRQCAIFAHELLSALRLTVGISILYCEL